MWHHHTDTVKKELNFAKKGSKYLKQSRQQYVTSYYINNYIELRVINSKNSLFFISRGFKKMQFKNCLFNHPVFKYSI
jgi:hypothetical protein